MDIFYGYVEDKSSGAVATIVITFPSYEVADEWWRSLSGHPLLAPCIKRIAPQIYKWDSRNETKLFNNLRYYLSSSYITSAFPDVLPERVISQMLYLQPADFKMNHARSQASVLESVQRSQTFVVERLYIFPYLYNDLLGMSI